MTERRADEATRDVADWLKCEFMQDHVGDEFSGVISTVTNFGMFIRLKELHIEGLVHITSLGRDYYHFDDVRMCLTGENSGTKFRVGDVVDVQVAAVNLDEKKIDLVLSGSHIQLRDDKSGEPQKNKGKSKSKTSANKKSKAKKTDGATASTVSKPSGGKKKTKEKPVKSKAKKRSARKPRPGKNARQSVKNNPS